MKEINELNEKIDARTQKMIELNDKALEEKRDFDEKEQKEYNSWQSENDADLKLVEKYKAKDELNKRKASVKIEEKQTQEKNQDVLTNWADEFRKYLKRGYFENDEFRGANGGMIVPREVTDFALEQRANPIKTSTDAGMIPKTISPYSIKTPAGLDWLRSMGATFDEDLVGNYALTSIANVTVGFVDEGSDASTASPDPSSNTLTPRLLGGEAQISRHALRQTNPKLFDGVLDVINRGIGETIATDAMTQLASDIGTNRLQSTVVVAPSYDKMLDFDSSISVSQLNPIYIMSKAGKNYLRKTLKAAATSFVVEDNEIDGTPVFDHPSLTANRFFYADANDIHVGFWGPPEIIIDNITNSGKITVKVVQLCDTGYANKATAVYYDSSTF